jgi:polyhydroxyalkanoate depolymerase
MFYYGYQALTDLLTPARTAARLAVEMKAALGPVAEWPLQKRFLAACEVFAGATVTHVRPPFHITEAQSGNETVPVREEVVLDLPFGTLLRFAKPEGGLQQPKMLVVAPMSGHFATLMRNTVQTLLRDHDVYLTDWKTARDVPLSAGAFGLDDYVDYVIRFLQELGPHAHVLAVCQPCVPVLMAVAVMAENKDPCQPRTMTLMGGPVDVREAPTTVTELAQKHPIEWFEQKLISHVPMRHKGAGRAVYPGFLQLTAFMAMNLDRHKQQHRKMYDLLVDGKPDEAHRIRNFYDEYFAVLDLPAEFYLDTIDRIFQRALLAKGQMTYRGRLVKPSLIHRTALLTVEGARDDICAVGQTAAAHLLCTGLRPHLKRHHLQPGVGHYGVFSGSKWETQVYPQVRNLVLAMS